MGAKGSVSLANLHSRILLLRLSQSYMALALCGCSIHSLTPPVVVATSFLPGLGAAVILALVTVASTKVLELTEACQHSSQAQSIPHPFTKALWPFLPLFCHLPLPYGFFSCVAPLAGLSAPNQVHPCLSNRASLPALFKPFFIQRGPSEPCPLLTKLLNLFF